MTNFEQGNIYNIYLYGGFRFYGEFLRLERGFFVFKDEATDNEIPVRESSIQTIIKVCPCCQCNPCDCH